MLRHLQARSLLQNAFTLIELSIVLLILVACAGVMIPLMNGYIEKAHAGTCASNIESVTRAVEGYKVKQLYIGYPDHMD